MVGEEDGEQVAGPLQPVRNARLRQRRRDEIADRPGRLVQVPVDASSRPCSVASPAAVAIGLPDSVPAW